MISSPDMLTISGRYRPMSEQLRNAWVYGEKQQHHALRQSWLDRMGQDGWAGRALVMRSCAEATGWIFYPKQIEYNK